MKKFRKRIFGAGVLFLMIILAIGTMVSFAKERDNSYQLTIKKVFAEGMTPEALEAAKKMTYNFRVEAQVKKSGEDAYDSVVETVKLPDSNGNWSTTVSFESAFKISVIEQTDDSGGSEYDVTKTVCESSMHVGASQATVNISKDDGTIKVTRPEGVPTVTFQLTGKPFHEHNAGSFNFTTQTQTVEAGKTATFDNLPQGQYTITKLRSADGFSVLVGSRSLSVAPGGTGSVHINGSDSKLLITAPPADGGVVRTHHYKISGVTSGGGSVSRDVDVTSGNTATVEHLTEGDYSISVSETYSGIKGYTVTFPETTVRERSEKSSALTYTDTRSYKGLTVNDADYVEFYGFGPLYNGSDKKMASSVTYKMNYGVINPDTGGVVRRAVSGTYPSNGTYTLKNPVKLVAADNKLYFAATNVSDTAAKKILVKWREYTMAETTRTVKNPSSEGDLVTIDDRGWITLSKDSDSDVLGGKVSYYYTITDSNGVPITGYTVTDDKTGTTIPNPTDKSGTTVLLRAGQRVTISGLHDGNFHIKEEVQPVSPMGFDVTLEDTVKSVTTPEGSINIEILDARQVRISRPGNPNDDGNRVYTYNIYEVGKEEPVSSVTLHSGETTTVAEQTGSMLSAGKYYIKAVDDKIVGFDVSFSDSSSLVSDYIKEAAVTFTNHISKVEASYHVIHEYYLDNGDGSYTFEGASPVYTKNCDGSHNDKAGHYSSEVHLLDVHDGKTYTHISDGGDAYGKVVSWQKNGGTEKEVPLTEDDKQYIYNGPYKNNWRGSNAEDTYQYAYVPLTNMQYATALPHAEADEKGAQIIILRYVRKNTPEEMGKYNIIHVYYRRTSGGDIWEGSRALETVDVGRLTNANRYTTYDASGVEKKLRFTPIDETVEYPYVYDGADYGRIVINGSADGESSVGDGKEYRKDASMTSVKATGEGDQIIILRYYRGGGYNVVHEYYYREKANISGDSGEAGEDSEGTTEGETDPSGGNVTREAEGGVSGNNLSATASDSDAARRKGNDVSDNDLPDSDDDGEAAQNEGNDVSGNNPQGSEGDGDASAGNTGTVSEGISEEETELTAYADESQTEEEEGGGFSGTLADSDGYAYEFEGNRDIVTYSDKLESKHYAENVRKERVFQPAGAEQYTYVYKDAVYGYVDKATGTYRVAPYMTGAAATSGEDEIIILRYIRGDGVREPEIPETPPEEPGPPGGGGGSDPDPTPPPEEPEEPEIPELPTELPDPNDPDSPDRITILENGVPRTYVKVWDPDKLKWVYIPEEEVPLWGLTPGTGDENGLGFLIVLAAASFGGLTVLRVAPQKKKDF